MREIWKARNNVAHPNPTTTKEVARPPVEKTDPIFKFESFKKIRQTGRKLDEWLKDNNGHDTGMSEIMMEILLASKRFAENDPQVVALKDNLAELGESPAAEVGRTRFQTSRLTPQRSPLTARRHVKMALFTGRQCRLTLRQRNGCVSAPRHSARASARPGHPGAAE